MWEQVAVAITKATGRPFRLLEASSIGGGCINDARRLLGEDGRTYFAKANAADLLSIFEAEAEALAEIAATNTIRVPEPICTGSTDDQSYLVLEFIRSGSSRPYSQRKLGEALARLHQVEQPHFGWKRDNAIGATPQPNPTSNNWPDFYREQRLQHQFRIAAQRGKTFTGSDNLLDCIPAFFTTYYPIPSLLHGDLWGGNADIDEHGKPFVFDPASYYGDREADLAFTHMFGGFSSEFYAAYENLFPLDPSFDIRKTLYNLYHELNHFNLFGGSYATSAQASIEHLLALAT